MFIIQNEGGYCMIDSDHVAFTVKNLEESISFYTSLGYQLINTFYDEEYNWAVLKLNNHSLELFEKKLNIDENLDHIAYNYKDFNEIERLINRLGYKKEDLDVFYGDLNRESFCIRDKDGKTIQLIKKSL